MKKKASSAKAVSAGDDLLPEYDFRGGVRGKYSRACRNGYTVKIRHEDGTTTVRKYVPAEDTVRLDPDVRMHFPDADKVNAALRALIALIPAEKRTPSGNQGQTTN